MWNSTQACIDTDISDAYVGNAEQNTNEQLSSAIGSHETKELKRRDFFELRIWF